MAGLMILVDGFETVEALLTQDLLKRAGIPLTLVSYDNLKVKSSSGVSVEVDKLYDEKDQYDFLILPGGPAIMNYHLRSEKTKKIIASYLKENKLTCFICAAPAVIGDMGKLAGVKYTCFPGCEELVKGGIKIDADVVYDKGIITSKACGTTFDFALKIIEVLKGKEKAEAVKQSIYLKK